MSPTAVHRRLGRFARPSPATVVVGLAMVASAVLLMYWSRGQWFSSDDLGYATRLATESFQHALLQPPPNKYLIAFPLLLYKALFEIFGLDTYVPYRVLGIALVLLCAGLLFALLRRWLPDRFAIPPTLLMLFFGAGSEVVATPIRIPSQIALAAGLGMMLLLTRGSRRSDLVAMVLLAVSLASHPIGISFAAVAAVLIVLHSWDFWRRLWVVAIPGVLFTLWWIFLRAPDLPSFVPNRPDDVVVFVRQSWVALIAAVTGLFGVVDAPAYGQRPVLVVAIALLGLIALGVAFSWRRLPPMFWAALVGLVVMMATTRLAPAGFFRHPDASRYLYPEAFLLLIPLGVLAGTLKLPGWAMWGASAVLLVSLWPNIDRLQEGGRSFARFSDSYRMSWSAVELAGSNVNPEFIPGSGSLTAGLYGAAVRDFGSGGYRADEIAGKPESLRHLADVVEVAALALKLEPAPGPPKGGMAPRVTDPRVAVTTSDGCATVSGGTSAGKAASERGGVEFVLPEAGAWLGLGRPAGASVFLARFADETTVPIRLPAGARDLELRIPADQASVPWRLTVRSRSPFSVCGLARGAEG
ncbi:MAG TPA: hypothetical protein VGE91_04510 [Solirubrobacterales bacterium]